MGQALCWAPHTLPHSILQTSTYKLGGTQYHIPILQMKKMRYREVNGHTASARAGPQVRDSEALTEVYKVTNTPRQTLSHTMQIHEQQTPRGMQLETQSQTQ